MHHDEPGILDLSIDILQRILMHLNAQDVLSCTKVCKKFLNATENNNIWQPLCKGFCDASTYVIDYVNTVPPTVKPVYSPPQEVQASVCEWRRVYMKLIQLKSNFLNGVYNSQLVTCYPNDIEHVLVGNGLLLIWNKAGNGIEAWSVRGKLRLLGMIMYAVTGAPVHVLHDKDYHIIVVEGLLLQVFKINVESGAITRMYRRLVNGNNYSFIPETENIDSWYRFYPKPEEVAICVTGKYVFGYVRLDGRNSLHQWNINTGQKIGEFNICENGNTYDDYTSLKLITPETYCGEFLVVLYKTNENSVAWALFQFNCEKWLYKFIMQNDEHNIPSIYFKNNKIYVIDDRKNMIVLHNLNSVSVTTPDEITIEYDRDHPINNFKIRGNIVSYIFGETLTIKSDSLNDIYSVSLLKNDEKVNVQYSLCDWNILLISFHGAPLKIGVIELHDIKAKSFLKIFDCQGIAIGLSSPLTVLVSNKSVDSDLSPLNVLNFW